jgi:hypothetical protein
MLSVIMLTGRRDGCGIGLVINLHIVYSGTFQRVYARGLGLFVSLFDFVAPLYGDLVPPAESLSNRRHKKCAVLPLLLPCWHASWSTFQAGTFSTAATKRQKKPLRNKKGQST